MKSIEAEVVVVGAGPGGYAAAFAAADRGKQVVLVEKDTVLGGVCLNRGCIPSKALLHAAKIISESKSAVEMGIEFGPPKIRLDRLREWKSNVLSGLTSGIAHVAKSKNVTVMTGRGYFEDSHTLRVETSTGQQFVKFKSAIIAVGSRPAIPAAFDLGNKRIMTSTEALDLEDIPPKLLVVGGGYIGMELGTVYATLGSKVVMMEAASGILAGADPDLVRPVVRYAKSHFADLRLSTKVVKMATAGKQINVTSETNGKRVDEQYDKVLVSIGRTPNFQDLGLENTKIAKTDKGFIIVNSQLQTAEPHIYAIGDIAGGLLLAHKASMEARIAVDALCGIPGGQTNAIIPAVVFTDPEVAWAGLMEADAKEKGIPVKVQKFSWKGSGRAASLGNSDGLTKLIIHPETERILGVGISGPNAGELISEGVLAIEMGATAMDLALTVHPHPTLSETLMEAAQGFYGGGSH